MLKKHSRIILVSLAIVSVLIGFGVTRYAVKQDAVPKPISEETVPVRFNIIGFDDSGEPVLLEHKISKPEDKNSVLLEKQSANKS